MQYVEGRQMAGSGLIWYAMKDTVCSLRPLYDQLFKRSAVSDSKARNIDKTVIERATHLK